MDFHIDAPDEIKPKIMQKITQNGILKSIKRKVKIGMMIAVEEIKNNDDSESNLERKIFKNADPYELKALQSIFNFLSTNKMNYTLSTLLEESAVRKSNTDTINVIDLIDAEINRPEIPINNYIIEEDMRYYDEIPQIAAKSKKKSNYLDDEFSSKDNINDHYNTSNNNAASINNYINPNRNEATFNTKFNSNIHPIDDSYASSITNNHFNLTLNVKSDYYNQINKQSTNDENNSKPRQEIQGFSISRRTFERNQFVISVVNL